MTDPNTIATLGGQIVAIIAAVTAMIAAIGALVTTLRTSRKIDDVEKLANGNLTAERARVDQLTEIVSHTNLPIPPRPETPERIDPSH